MNLIWTYQFLSTSSCTITKWFLTLPNSLQNNFNFTIFITYIGYNICKLFEISLKIGLLTPLITCLNKSGMITQIINFYINWINKLRYWLTFDQPINQLYIWICCYNRTYDKIGLIILIVYDIQKCKYKTCCFQYYNIDKET